MALIETDDMLIAMKIARTPANLLRYDLLREQAEAAIKAWCKWGIEEDSITEYHDGSGTQNLVLRKPFVSAVANVWVDASGFYGDGPNAFGPSTLIVAGTDYALVRDDGPVGKSGVLRRLTYPQFLFPGDMYLRRPGGLSYSYPSYWQSGSGNIKVEYTYGFAPKNLPVDLQAAVEGAVGILSNSVKRGFPTVSESLGAYSYTLAITREPEWGSVRQLLSRYRDTSL